MLLIKSKNQRYSKLGDWLCLGRGGVLGKGFRGLMDARNVLHLGEGYTGLC